LSSLQELMDRGLPESVLGPVRQSVLEVQGVEVYNQILHQLFN
jgi:divalent metal cation (Fe/Co/Zn/Cd) transporter